MNDKLLAISHLIEIVAAEYGDTVVQFGCAEKTAALVSIAAFCYSRRIT